MIYKSCLTNIVTFRVYKFQNLRLKIAFYKSQVVPDSYLDGHGKVRRKIGFRYLPRKKIRGAVTQRPNFFFKQFSKSIFCSALSEFENFFLCERILINVTICQNETPS
jgi:hypothetical protein